MHRVNLLKTIFEIQLGSALAGAVRHCSAMSSQGSSFFYNESAQSVLLPVPQLTVKQVRILIYLLLSNLHLYSMVLGMRILTNRTLEGSFSAV